MAPTPLYTLDAASMALLRRLVHDEMRRVKTNVGRDFSRYVSLQSNESRTYIAKTTTAITAGTVVTPGSGTAALQWVDWDGGSDAEYITDATNTITVYSMFGEIPSGHVLVVSQDVAGRFWVLFPQIETRYRGLAQGAMASGDSTHTIDNLTLTSGFSWGLTSLTGYNVHGYAADDNAIIRVEWCSGTSHWEIYQATCPA